MKMHTIRWDTLVKIMKTWKISVKFDQIRIHY